MSSIIPIPKSPGAKKPNKSKSKGFEFGGKDHGWTIPLTVGGFFFGLISLVWLGGKTFVTAWDLSRLLTFCCAFGLLLPVWVFRKYWGISRPEGFLVGILGLGPMICGILLFLNYFIRSEELLMDHQIITHKFRVENMAGATITFELANDYLKNWESFRRFDVHAENKQIVKSTSVRYFTATGLLGYTVLIDREPVFSLQ